ncbi:MAG: HPr family phosphocarrier protein [Spirochaetaceae bacterium]|jgi:phosphocarrier protein|nr:HPr family phosphocarrier protein [Spirochaetaceae bacterium]
MQTINYTIKDQIGIHARPAGELIKKAKEFTSEMVIAKGESSADLKKLFAVLKLGVKCGETVTITITGADEEPAASALKSFLEANL